MTLNLTAISQMIAFAHLNGRVPAEIHVNKATAAILKNLQPQQKDTRSPMTKMFSKRGNEYVSSGPFILMGLPVVENDKCGDGCLALRFQEAMDDPNWLDSMLPTAAAEKQPEPETPVTLQSLQTAGGMQTVTDILIRGVEQAERTNAVIVLSLMKNGNLEIAGNIDRMGMIGTLQMALSNVMQGN